MKNLSFTPVALAFVAFFAAPAFATHVSLNGNGLPHIPGNNSYHLNIHAYDHCLGGTFDGSDRHTISVKSSLLGGGHPDLLQTNDILLKAGPDFRVLDGNACDDPAEFQLPANVSTEWEVYFRLVGKPNTSVDIATCGTIDGAIVCGTALVKTRTAGQPKFTDETRKLLTIDGALLFTDATDPWWDWQATDKAKAQLVFVPAP